MQLRYVNKLIYKAIKCTFLFFDAVSPFSLGIVELEKRNVDDQRIQWIFERERIKTLKVMSREKN